MKLKKSMEYLKKAERLIPACTQTLSKGPTQFVQGVCPVYIQRGKGSHVWDVDGNEYIDYTMALGPVTLGYAYPGTAKAVEKQLKEGITFTLPHPLEIKLAEILIDIIPCAEMVRFGKNGSDVTSAAVRLARAYTGREKIVCCGYHGWQDWFIATTTRDMGIPESTKKLTLTFEYNKIETLEKIFSENKNEIAAVIMEPVSTIEPEKGFLEDVKKITKENGAVLIFDEIVTGFRISLGGAQEYFNVTPDMACFGKGMANGMPLSTIVGKREIMKKLNDVFFSFTFGGETTSIAAAISTINEMKKKNAIKHFWKQGKKIKEGYNKLAKKHGMEKYTECIGLPPRTVIKFKDEKGNDSLEMKSLFQQECAEHGILFTGAHNICLSHSDSDIEKTIEVYDKCLQTLKSAIEKNNIKKMLKGNVVKPVFRKI